MKGKLIKENNGYTLFVDGKIFGDTEGHPLKSITNRLSIKNCQAIERDYDLDELVEKEVEGTPKGDERLQRYYGFRNGFEKALEILGDKRYSQEDILKAIAFGWDYEGKSKEEMLEIYNINLEYNNSYFEDTQKYIQSLQQTEWDVTIVTKNSRTGKIVNSDSDLEWDEDGLCDVAIPKLDSDGCLILKRI